MASATDRVRLADEPGFCLGSTRVEPSARQVHGPDGTVHTLQPKAMQLLVALHRYPEKTVARDQLMDICWEGRVVGEDSLDRLVSQLRKVATDTGEAFAIETIRGVGLCLRVTEDRAVDAAHPAETETPQQGTTVPASGPAWPRRLVFGVGLLLALALGVGLWSIRSAPDPSAASAPLPAANIVDAHSLAVLPFRTFSPEPEDDLLAGGITEEVTQAVAALPGVRVTARSSAEAAQAAGLAADATARALGVAHLIEGAVRRTGTRIRVNARLVRAGDASVVWSSEWERDFTDDFDVAALIAGEVASNLEVAIDPAARAAMAQRGIGNVEAFIAFERGRRQFFDAHDEDAPALFAGLERANRAFDSAIARAPMVGEIHQMRADLATHVLMDWAGYVPADMRARGLAWWKAELAADLDAGFAKARPGVERAMADVHRTIASDNWRGLADKLKLALEDDQCAEVFWPWLSEMQPLVQDGSIHRFYARQRICNPLDPFVASFYLGTMVAEGRPEAALAAYDRLSPELRAGPLTTRAKFRALVMLGRYDAAHRLLETSPVLSPAREMVQLEKLRLLLLEGRKAEAAALYEELIRGTTYITRRLVMAAWMDDKALVAQLASEMDAMPLGHMKLLYALGMCRCGAMFPLEKTPNFAARLAESGLSWPPPRRFPLPGVRP